MNSVTYQQQIQSKQQEVDQLQQQLQAKQQELMKLQEQYAAALKSEQAQLQSAQNGQARPLI